MSSNQQILLALGGGAFAPPVQICVGDPYYLGPSPFTVLSLHGQAVVDSSFDTKTLTNFGVTVSTAQSRFGGSSLFFASGTPTYLAAPATAFQFAAGTPFTVEFYIYLVAAPSGGTADVICLGGPGAGPGNAPVRSGWAVGITSSRQVQFRVGDLAVSTYNAVLTTAALSIGAWTQVTISFFGTTTAPLVFFDGVAQATTAFGAVSWAVVTPSEADSTQLFVGQYDRRAGGIAVVALNAYVDDLRVTAGVARYPAPIVVPSAPFPNAAPADPFFSNVVLLAHMDGANGSMTVVDSSSYGINTTIVETVADAAEISTAESRFGGASLALNNKTFGAYTVSWPSNGIYNISSVDFTIEMWMYEKAGSDGSLICRRQGSAANGWVLTMTGVRAAINGVYSDTQLTWTRPSQDTWHHIALVRSGQFLLAYIDGNFVAARGGVNAFGGDQAVALALGQSDNASENKFIGFIDDVRFTVGVARYTGNFTPPNLTFCDSINNQFSGQTNGEDRLPSQVVTTAQGAVRVLNPWVRLQGQAITTAAGALSSVLPNRTQALTGQQIQAIQGIAQTSNRTTNLSGASVSVLQGTPGSAPYPNLNNATVSATQRIPGISGSICTVTVSTDGTFSVVGLLGGTLGSGTWIDTSNGSFSIPAIASQYQIERIIPLSVVELESPALPANLGSSQTVRVPPEAPRPSDVSFIVVIGPTNSNPRFGEPGYNAQIAVRLNIRNT